MEFRKPMKRLLLSYTCMSPFLLPTQILWSASSIILLNSLEDGYSAMSGTERLKRAFLKDSVTSPLGCLAIHRLFCLSKYIFFILGGADSQLVLLMEKKRNSSAFSS